MSQVLDTEFLPEPLPSQPCTVQQIRLPAPTLALCLAAPLPSQLS